MNKQVLQFIIEENNPTGIIECSVDDWFGISYKIPRNKLKEASNLDYINNTGVVCEDLKFSIKIMDNEGNIIVELTDKVKGTMETGTTKTIETKVDKDLANVASIEYSIVN